MQKTESKQSGTDSLKSMLEAALKFRDDRDWKEYHTPRNLVMNLVREASETLEVCLWETDEFLLQNEERRQDMAQEMADVLTSLLLLSNTMQIDLAQAFWDKLQEVDERYPAQEFKKKSTYKYKKKLKAQ